MNCPADLILSNIKEKVVRIVDKPNEKKIEKIIKLFVFSKKRPPANSINTAIVIKLITKFKRKVNIIFDKQKTDKSKGMLIRINSP